MMVKGKKETKAYDFDFKVYIDIHTHIYMNYIYISHIFIRYIYMTHI